MLTIRQEQYGVIEENGLRRFEDDMLIHVGEFFPKHLETSGETRVRRVIQRSVDLAQSLGTVAERDVGLILDLMLLLGHGFSEDFQLATLTSLLDDEREYEMGRRERLCACHEASLEWLDAVAGVNDEHLQSARTALTYWCSGAASVAGPNGVVGALQELYPEKVAALPEGALAEIISSGARRASVYGLNEAATALFLGGMLVWGSGFDRDPLFPWVDAVFLPEQPVAAAERSARFVQACADYLNGWIS